MHTTETQAKIYYRRPKQTLGTDYQYHINKQKTKKKQTLHNARRVKIDAIYWRFGIAYKCESVDDCDLSCHGKV